MMQAPRRHHPDDYKHTPADRFTLNHDLEDIYKNWTEQVLLLDNNNEEVEDNNNKDEEFLLKVLAMHPRNEEDLRKALVAVRREMHLTCKKSSLLRVLARLVAANDARLVVGGIPATNAIANLRPLLIKKAGKSASGVLVVTMLTSPHPVDENGKPQPFTCQWNCHYCPAEPGQPRSYLHDEPSVLRANRDGFDPVLQFFDRVATLASMGHPCDKVELLILGGTWDSYPAFYREQFCRDIFYAGNCFSADLAQALQRTQRSRGTLQEEKTRNETTDGCKIIGLTMETRPDCINAESLAFLRRMGCTRLQLGLQHTENDILTKINRGHTVLCAQQALTLLKNSCFKVDVHLMPNLPFSSSTRDSRMLARALGDPDLQADQWKIYPTEVTPWTVIEKWFREGTYVPYGEDELMNVLVEVKSRIHPWIRINRVVRDIPSQYILGGVNAPSMRQDVQVAMKRAKSQCQCIRCREVGTTTQVTNMRIIERFYVAQGAIEVFLEMGCDENKVIGFCRLRLPQPAGCDNHSAFELGDFCALVRELHVYGHLAPTKEVVGQRGARDGESHTQHSGVGTKLMRRAEAIALDRGYTRMAVIAGVGARGFYEKLGYLLELGSGGGEMMVRDLNFGNGKTCGVM